MSALSAADADATVMDVQIAVEGNYVKDGFAFTIDEAVIDQVIENFNRRKSDVPADYGHAMLRAAVTPDQHKASGWLKALSKRKGPDGWQLWGSFKPTAKAREAVRNEEFRYVSPALDFDARDNKGNKIGVELTNFALTNLPFIDGMKALECSRETPMADEPSTDEITTDETLEAAEGGDDTASSDAVLQALGAALGVDAAAAGEFVMAHIEQIASLGTSMLGSQESDEKTVEASRVADVLRKRNAFLLSRVTELEKQSKKFEASQFEADLDNAIKSGAVQPGERAGAVVAFSKSPEVARIAYLSRTAPVGVATSAPPEAPVGLIKRDAGGRAVVELSALNAAGRAIFAGLEAAKLPRHLAFERAVERQGGAQ